MDPTWIKEDGFIDFDKLAAFIEENKDEATPERARKWFESHDDIIDWDDFEEWAEKVIDKEGYEWLREVVAEWEANDGDVPKEWIREDGLIEWSYAAEYVEENKWDMDPVEARKWLEDHAEIIDWDQFTEWAEKVGFAVLPSWCCPPSTELGHHAQIGPPNNAGQHSSAARRIEHGHTPPTRRNAN